MKKCVIWLAVMVLYVFTIIAVAASTWEKPTVREESVTPVINEITVQTEAYSSQYREDWTQETESEYYEEEDCVPKVVRGYANAYDTIVVVDLANQHVYCCVDGAIIADADCVSGDSNSSPTPTGMFRVWIKRSNFYMLDVYYSSYAVFFNGGIAIHDADTWRSEYGGTIYQQNGSHGCINTPGWFAEIVYNNTDIGTPVYVF